MYIIDLNQYATELPTVNPSMAGNLVGSDVSTQEPILKPFYVLYRSVQYIFFNRLIDITFRTNHVSVNSI